MRRSSVFNSLDALQCLELKISLSSLAASGIAPPPTVSVTAVFDDGDPPPNPEPPPSPGKPEPPILPGSGPGGPG
jgi:hypothetical protein